MMECPKYFYFRVKPNRHGTVIEIEDASDADVVEVVRCKNCKHSEEALLPNQELWCKVKDTFCTSDWFCADGKKRGKENE